MKKHRIYTMNFAKVYGCLVAKAEKKQRSKAEVDEVTCWLTGYSQEELDEKLQSDADYESFFLTPRRSTHCGLRLKV